MNRTFAILTVLNVVRGSATERALMRLPLLGVVWVICLLGAGITQSADAESIPCAIGNRANGFSYQPTPREVDPREASLGLRPSREHQASMDQALENLDRSLMRDEGLSTASVPRFTSRQ
jgi:hypothetical protein